MKRRDINHIIPSHEQRKAASFDIGDASGTVLSGLAKIVKGIRHTYRLLTSDSTDLHGAMGMPDGLKRIKNKRQ